MSLSFLSVIVLFYFLFLDHILYINFLFSGLIVQGTPVNIIVGSQVWVEDPEIAWIDGEVTKINGTNATIITTDGKTVRFLLDH